MPYYGGNASAYYGLPTRREEAEDERGTCEECGSAEYNEDGTCPECGAEVRCCPGCGGRGDEGNHSRCHLIP